MYRNVVLYLPVGAVAAILTACEYFLTTVVAISAHAIFRGLWLASLHKSRRKVMSPTSRARRALWRDFFIFMSSLALVISVALVEMNLISTVIIQDNLIFTKHCIPLNLQLNPRLLEFFVPPLSTLVEPWTVQVAQNLHCPNRAISTIGTGGGTTVNGRDIPIFAPVCAEKQSIPSLSDVSVSISEILLSSSSLVLRPGRTALVELFPESAVVGRSLSISSQTSFNGTYILNDTAEECSEVSIAPSFLQVHPQWRSVVTDSSTVSTTVWRKVCSSKTSALPAPIQSTLVQRCFDHGKSIIDVNCVREVGNEYNALGTAVISNVSALFVGKSETDPTYACVDSSLRVEYALLSGSLASFLSPLNPGNSVLIPTRASAISGHCERAVHIISRGALVYSMDAELRQTLMTDENRITRYHAFIIAIASTQTPLDAIIYDETLRNHSCLVHQVDQATVVEWTWRAVLMHWVMFLALFLALFAVCFRVWFRGSTWKIGSAQWALLEFAKENRSSFDEDFEGELEMEVVVEPATAKSMIDAEFSSSMDMDNSHWSDYQKWVRLAQNAMGHQRRYKYRLNRNIADPVEHELDDM